MDIADVLLYVTPGLALAAQRSLEERLRGVPGVIAPRFNLPGAPLLLVAYDPAQLPATVLLQQVRAAGYKAVLVGM